MEGFPDVSTLSDKALKSEQAWVLHEINEIRRKLPLSCSKGGYHPTSKRPAARERLAKLEARLRDVTAELARRGLVRPR